MSLAWTTPITLRSDKSRGATPKPAKKIHQAPSMYVLPKLWPIFGTPCICGLSLAFNQPFSYLICQGTAFFGALPGALLHRCFFLECCGPYFPYVLYSFTFAFKSFSNRRSILWHWQVGDGHHLAGSGKSGIQMRTEYNCIGQYYNIQHNSIQQMVQRK